MTDAAIISGSLVDVRNVGTHKSVKLTIHVPEEFATKVVAAFGWPTGVNPVSVAIARLDPSKLAGSSAVERGAVNAVVEGSIPSRSATSEKTKRRFDEMSPAQQAGMLCADRAFRTFLHESYPRWNWNGVPDERTAALVRKLCGVNSRSDITTNNAEWTSLVLSYRLWQHEPEVVPA